MRKVIITFLMLGSMTIANAEGSTVNVGPIIEQLGASLPEIRKTITKRDQAPGPGMFTYWSRDKYQADLDETLDHAFQALIPDVYGPTREALKNFDAAIAHGKREISELKVRMLTAPNAAEGGSLVDRALRRSVPSGSREDLENQIATIETESAAVENAKSDLIEDFSRKLSREYGITIEPDQAKAALYQVNGASIVEAVLASSILLDVEVRLKEILALGIEPEVAKKYYGIAALNRLIILRMHERHIASYEQDWFPKLDRIEADNTAGMKGIKDTIGKATTDANVVVARANLAVRKKIADVVTRYRRILSDRHEVTLKAFDKADEDAEVALQTLKTLESASQLGTLYEESSAEFSALMQIKAPELLPLDDAATLEQFIDISDEMFGS
ncbi:hypothetical protein [uncultured Nitratireductor sp.]|uniref:hypothetical protein n=1 Tax=uncultured Nitratireductor sp. TaxID=520953 RepID=UPI002608112C|nr:hypothetical protein [uncultured Nitratireductor sp.]